jgi:cytokinin riboside 5'-monophosphate phosphoribohydrolase
LRFSVPGAYGYGLPCPGKIPDDIIKAGTRGRRYPKYRHREVPVEKVICIYSSSSETIDGSYKTVARELGRAIADQGWSMVFGGGLQGLMGASARGIHDRKGRVTGVIPEKMHRPNITYMDADELVITPSMNERKRIMDARADAFIALPGGIGTLEEIVETLTLKQLGYHDRPVLFFNAFGFYDRLFAFFDYMVEQHCYKPEHRKLYTVVQSTEDAIQVITDYNTPIVPSKFD